MKKRPMSREAYSSLGGNARARKLSAKRRSAIAKKAAKARWAKLPVVAFQYSGPPVTSEAP